MIYRYKFNCGHEYEIPSSVELPEDVYLRRCKEYRGNNCPCCKFPKSIIIKNIDREEGEPSYYLTQEIGVVDIAADPHHYAYSFKNDFYSDIEDDLLTYVSQEFRVNRWSLSFDPATNRVTFYDYRKYPDHEDLMSEYAKQWREEHEMKDGEVWACLRDIKGYHTTRLRKDKYEILDAESAAPVLKVFGRAWLEDWNSLSWRRWLGEYDDALLAVDLVRKEGALYEKPFPVSVEKYFLWDKFYLRSCNRTHSRITYADSQTGEHVQVIVSKREPLTDCLLDVDTATMGDLVKLKEYVLKNGTSIREMIKNKRKAK